ncbi:DUF3397 family protein [Desemzia sp. FAM 23991]|uniref:DUF3397 family protein n=1 Tax=unclassified Desemzia TaxID=2685243 RepID=UPI0038869BE1
MWMDSNVAMYIVLLLLPIILFVLFNKKINHHFMKQQLTVKMADLLVPYLIVGIHIISSLTFGMSLFPYFLIFIFTLAIILLLYLAVKKGEILYYKFFKSWWRFVFISSMITYYGLAATTIVISL